MKESAAGFLGACIAMFIIPICMLAGIGYAAYKLVAFVAAWVGGMWV